MYACVTIREKLKYSVYLKIKLYFQYFKHYVIINSFYAWNIVFNHPHPLHIWNFSLYGKCMLIKRFAFSEGVSIKSGLPLIQTA